MKLQCSCQTNTHKQTDLRKKGKALCALLKIQPPVSLHTAGTNSRPTLLAHTHRGIKNRPYVQLFLIRAPHHPKAFMFISRVKLMTFSAWLPFHLKVLECQLLKWPSFTTLCRTFVAVKASLMWPSVTMYLVIYLSVESYLCIHLFWLEYKNISIESVVTRKQRDYVGCWCPLCPFQHYT